MKSGRYFIAFVNWFFITFFLFAPLYLSKIGIPGHTIGILASFYHILPIFLYSIAGTLCDLLSPRFVLMFGFSLLSVSSLLLLSMRNLPSIAVAYFLGSAGIVLVSIGVDTVFYESSQEEEEFSRYIGSGGIGMGLGYILAGVLTGGGGFKTFFFTLFVLAILASIFSFRVKDTRRSEREKFSFSFLRNRNFVLLASAMFFHGLHFGAETTSLAIFLKKEIGLTHEVVGLFLGISILFLSFSGMISGRIYRMGLSPKAIFVLGLLISGTGNILMALSTQFIYILLFRLVHVSGDAFIFVGSRLVTSRYFDMGNIGRIWGGVRTFTSSAAFIGAILAGVLMEMKGARVPFIFTGFASGFASLFIP